MSKATVLAIETSCDETAVSIVQYDKNGPRVLSNQISSQVKLHAKWGGVVPNLAAREHVKNMPLVLKNALLEAKISPAQIDAIAVTSGPGLIPALLVGTQTAKTLAYLWNKPLIGIHHIEGHIYSNFVRVNPKSQTPNPKQIQNSKNQKLQTKNFSSFPVLALVVSGGHTQLVLMKDHFKYEIVGQTVDDAVGEAFDKVARILGIGYPGGPQVAQWATKFKNTKNQQLQTKNLIVFPRPMMHKKNFNFSFSGLKTAVLYETKKYTAIHGSSTPIKGVELPFPKDYIAEVCHEFQQACVDVLIAKTLKAAEKYAPKTIMLAGGVSANTELRKQLGEAIEKFLPTTNYQLPTIDLTGDNAAMIGVAAVLRWQKMSQEQKKKTLAGWKSLHPDANLKFAK